MPFASGRASCCHGRTNHKGTGRVASAPDPQSALLLWPSRPTAVLWAISDVESAAFLESKPGTSAFLRELLTFF